MTEFIFIGSFFMLFYIYAGYPAVVYALSRIRPKHIMKGTYEPTVTVLIAAYNEERSIGATIENKLSLNYPEEKREIIVISDGSTDRTDEIVNRFASRGVRMIRQEPRAGKTSGLNLGVLQARGEILVFSDANSMYDHDALKYLVQNFLDPSVGYVTGKMIYTNPDGTVIGDGCSAYMKYENFLRSSETLIGSIVGVDGGVDAVRRSLYAHMRPDQLPDFILPLNVVEQGFRVVYEEAALLKEPALGASRDEYRMRVRVALRALWALRDMRHLMNIRKYPLFAWELFSHKYLRYGAFVFLIALYVANMVIFGLHPLYQTAFILQNLFYGAALLSLALDRFGRSLRIFYVPYYFTLLNLASAHAFAKFSAGQKQTIWTPRKGA